METTVWIVAMLLAVMAGLFGLKVIADGLFWCFAWCFCRLDDYFRDRHMRQILENLERLDRIAVEAEEVA